MDSALGGFSEDVLEKIQAAEIIAEQQLERIDTHCQKLKRELTYWEEAYYSADNEEDDVGYFAYKRDETEEKLNQARRLQRQVEEYHGNFALSCRRIKAIAGGRLNKAQSFLHQKTDELREYARIAVPERIGVVSNSITPSINYSPPLNALETITDKGERLTGEAVIKRYNEIAGNGHTVQRHGEHITEQQLDDRVLKGVDPATGTKYDAYSKKPDGTLGKHKFVSHATKFTSKIALVRAEMFIRNTQEFKDKAAAAVSFQRAKIRIETIKLQDIYGDDYKKHVFGKTIISPTRADETNFTDSTIFALFRKNADGEWNLQTMFPKPKN